MKRRDRSPTGSVMVLSCEQKDKLKRGGARRSWTKRNESCTRISGLFRVKCSDASSRMKTE